MKIKPDWVRWQDLWFTFLILAQLAAFCWFIYELPNIAKAIIDGYK